MAPFMKHELERKYKKWRRGKSKKGAAGEGAADVSAVGTGQASVSKGSLKQQIRGKVRLLERLQQQQPQEGPMESSLEILDKLRDDIQELRQEMERKEALEKERQNAVKSHGTRFLERQRLTRMERAIKVGRAESDGYNQQQLQQGENENNKERMLQKIALDMVYVAYHPNDVKYQQLFRKGIRVIDDRKAIVKRAKTRRRILQSIKMMGDLERRKVSWISPEHYERLPKVDEWSVEWERHFFGERASSGSDQSTAALQLANDVRFQLDLNQQHAALLAFADQIEADLDKNQTVRKSRQADSRSNHSSSSQEKLNPENSSTSSSVDDHDDDDNSSHLELASDEDDPAEHFKSMPKPATRQVVNMKGGINSGHGQADFDGSMSHTESSNNKANVATSGKNTGHDDIEENDFEDDFLIPAFNDDVDAFAKPAAKSEPLSNRKRDKSKGWATQRQRPGQFKRRKTRK